ncbi:MAG TPA: hypothetical protein VME21_10025 [Steroidobacteraceae bacterium]|nr:hypothetical protein [Steroidobacteraceae bacterium]
MSEPLRTPWLVAPILLFAATLGRALAAPRMMATLRLSTAAITSAAVFDAHQHLLRTLWSGRRLAAGSIDVHWDGLDDEGAPAAGAPPYRVRLLSHQVSYVWEGVIANTSAELVGPHVYRSLEPLRDMAIDGSGNAFYVVGYNEQQSGIHRFRTADPQRPSYLAHDDYRRVFAYAAADGRLAYFANVGLSAPLGSPLRDLSTFVIALEEDDGSEYGFSSGQRVGSPEQPEHFWRSAIDYQADDSGPAGARADAEPSAALRPAATGLAVQRAGNALFIAHGPLDEVRILDKRSGLLLQRLAVPGPMSIAVGPDESLWVLSRAQAGCSLVRYRSSAAQWQRVQVVRLDLGSPVAIGVSPLDGTVVVADASTEQLRAFDSTGKPTWTLGRAGGYRGADPTVAPNKLWLSAGSTYIAFDADGSFWVGDPGNSRNLHFSAERRFLGEIMYMTKSYHVAVDPAQPSRVFDRYLEFEVDYDKPLQRSWRLVRNWAPGMSRASIGDFDGFRAVVTLRNGRTYAVVPRFDSRASEIVELAAAGVRPTGTQLALGTQLYPDGSLRSATLSFGTFTVYERSLAGFDAAGNPQWSAPRVLAGVSRVLDRDPYYHDVPVAGGVNEASFPLSERGLVIFFNPGRNAGFHLGAVRPPDSTWLWRASPSGPWALTDTGGIESPDGRYDIDHGVQYPGSVVLTLGREIIYGYHGEGWNGGEANQWLHFRDDGLFVGQFGEPVYAATNKVSAAAGRAGNAFSAQLVSVHGRVYLWHNDESVHGGVHRWRIDGIERMQLLEASLQ